MKPGASPMPLGGMAPQPPRERVLVIDSQDESRRALQLLLQGCGLEVRAFASAAAAMAETAIEQVRTLLVARQLPDGDAFQLLQRLAERGWNGRAILIASQSHDELDECARAAGFAGVVKKPVGRLELLGALAR